jgi:cytochrome c oxidase assembly protein Cox11
MMPARRWLLLLFLLLSGFTGWLGWRYTSPVTVEISSTVLNLPFEVETIPAVVEAKPGEMVRVIYRVTNNSLTGLEAYATITIEPGQASEQLEVFLSQCTGLNTFQNNRPEEYEVLFRVEPAGLTGSQHLVLRHTFEAATARYPELDQ